MSVNWFEKRINLSTNLSLVIHAKETRIIIRYLISLLLFVDTRTSEPLRDFKQQNNVLFQLKLNCN